MTPTSRGTDTRAAGAAVAPDRMAPRPAHRGWEQSGYMLVRRLRDRLLSPVTAFLALARVPPSLVSCLGVAFALTVCLTLPERPLWALAGFLLALLCDAVDGALARRLGAGSVFGKVVDQSADLATFASLMLALALAGVASPAALAFAVGAAALLLALGVRHHSTRRAGGRYLEPRGGFFAHFPKALVYAAMALYLAIGIDWIVPTLLVANALAVLFACGFLVAARGSRPAAEGAWRAGPADTRSR